MNRHEVSLDNKIKQLNGQLLTEFLKEEFASLVRDGMIKKYDSKVNFTHYGFSYQHQYLANFVITTLDDKFIVVNNSNSYRQDRHKTDAYNLLGISRNASISRNVIASILLFPDSELENTSFISFRKKVINKEAYSPATHLFVVTEFIDFIQQHKVTVEVEIEDAELEALQSVKSGSYFGVQGNKFEKEIVSILNNTKNTKQFVRTSKSNIPLYDLILENICNDKGIKFNDVVEVNATDTIPKLRSGGNAKTDVLVEVKTLDQSYKVTFSAKKTSQTQVSCHDYRSQDFVRVIGCAGTRLEYYLEAFQKAGSTAELLNNLPESYSPAEFSKLLSTYSIKLTEWALSGQHDEQNLIEPETQVSQYIIIQKGECLIVKSIMEYIEHIFANSKLTFSVPFQWTYPSKRRGQRIQLKLPIREF